MLPQPAKLYKFENFRFSSTHSGPSNGSKFSGLYPLNLEEKDSNIPYLVCDIVVYIYIERDVYIYIDIDIDIYVYTFFSEAICSSY